MMDHNLVTNIYQVYQHMTDMKMEYYEWHKQLYQVLDLTCNDNAK